MKRTKEAAKATRDSILMTAMNLIREKGFAATRVEDVCAAAGITKGAYFHHFRSKEEMAEQAAQFFSDYAATLFATADYQRLDDPLDRFLGYLELRESILQGRVPEYTCLLGTMVQEVHQTHPALRAACQTHIWGHADTLVPMIEAALEAHPPRTPIDARELALFTQAVLQGGFVLAKASQSAETAAACVRHLRRYVLGLFGRDDASLTST